MDRGISFRLLCGVVLLAVASGCEREAQPGAAPTLAVSRQALSLGLAMSSGNAAFVGGGAAPSVPVDPGLTISGTDTLTGAVVGIGAGFSSSQDRLSFTNLGAISGSYDSARGTLTLTGSGTTAEYQAALRTVQFGSASSAPTAGTRVISMSLGTAVSNSDNGHFYEFVSYGGTWTQAKNNAATRTYLGMTGYLATLTTAAENDFVRLKLTSDGWIGAQSNPEASYPRTWYWVTGPEAGTGFCYNASSGSCTSVSGRFSNWASGEPNNAGGEGCGQIYFTNSGKWNDLPCNATVLSGYVVEYGGSAGDPTATISGTRNVVVSYTATTVTPTASTLVYGQGSGAVAIDPGLVLGGTSTVTGATVSLSSGFVSGQDTLAFVTANGISGAYAAGTGVLTLSGTATVSAYQAALRAITYANAVAPLPNTTPRVVTFTIGGVSGTRALQVRALPTVALATSANPRSYQQPLTLTATLTPVASTGTVQFFADGSSLGSATLSLGFAALSTASLSLGSHALSAVYSGDAQRLTATGLASQDIVTMAAGEGPCTPANQATVCSSGLCNATTSTCGAANGGSCTVGNQCVSNVCALNGLCGVQSGGACTQATASQCQTGACSPNGNQCIPVGGCAVTADCGPGQQCNTGTYQCETAPGIDTSAGTATYEATGADVIIDPELAVVGTNPITGATVTLGTGFVSSQDQLLYATTGGISGSYNASTGILTLSGSASSAAYQAALRTVGYRNTAGALPGTGLRSVTFAIGSAVANGTNNHFYEFVSYTGSWTQARAHATTRSYLGLQGYLATLTSAAENDFVRQKLTSDGWIGAQATPQTTYPRSWYWVTGPESGTAFCANPSSGVCTSVSGGFSNWASGEPNNQGGEGCGQIYFANSGKWNDLSCSSGTLPGYVVEYGGTSGDPVLTLSDSKPLQVRAKTTLAMTSSAASAALHQSLTLRGTFTPAAATGTAQFFVDGSAFGAPVTISGGVASLLTTALSLGTHAVSVDYAGDAQHQPATGTRAGSITITPLSNGAGPCDATNAATDCQSGVCSAAGTCGYGLNEGPCAAAAASVCQSGVCSLGGACMPAGGCYVDVDCAAGTYCERTSNACVPMLAAGAPIPNDGLHDGTCPGGTSSACASGTCNVVTNTCSTDLGTSCTSASQCTSNACAPSGTCVPTGPGSCWADSDCAGTEFCSRAAYTCTGKLISGAPIPIDGLHTGVCTALSSAPTCATGQCNPTTNTCASPVGASCGGASECSYGTCSHGTCGFSSGEAGCDATTAYLCQSGACSASGVCIPPGAGGCFLDSDCPSADYCDRANYRCVAKGVAGSSLPNDGALHQGVCTQTLATAACVSGVCNAVTNTCAAANGETCTGASQCVTNICGGDGACGHPAGEGPCEASSAATACRSGFCNASANGNTSACVPSSSGCWVDDDCGADAYCARGTFTCTPKASPGGPLPGDGLHASCVDGVSAACASGLCNAVTNTCAQASSQPCTAAQECVSNACGSNGQCGLANAQPGCTAQSGATLCQSGACTPSGVCAPGGGCFIDSDCSAGQYCDRANLTCRGQLQAGTAIPNDGLHTGACDATGAAACAAGQCNASSDTCAAAKNVACATDAQCVSNQCGSNGKCGLADGQAGCMVGAAEPCQSGTCSSAGVCVPAQSNSCWVDADCAGAQHCRRDQLSCVADGQAGDALVADTLHDGVCSPATAQAVCSTGSCNPARNTCAAANATTCTDASQCVVDVCGANGQCGFADGQAGCTSSTAPRCQSQTCSSSGTCMPPSGCWVDADCAQGQYCDRAHTTCQGQLSSGAALPVDGLHDGACTPANASALCASGSCNAQTNTCGVENSQGCTQASECESNVCGPDWKCGAADGAECTTDSVCRNGCVEGRCANSDPGVLTGGGGCSATGAGTNAAWLLVLVAVLFARRSRRLSAMGVAMTVLLLGGPARAQTQVSSGASVDLFRNAAPGSDWFSTDSLDFRGTVRPSARLVIDWGHALLVVRDADGTVRSTPVQNQLWFHLGAGVTLFARVRVFANVPVAGFQDGAMSAFGGQPLVAGSAGLGDLGLGADVRLWGSSGSPFSLAVGATMTAPTGSSANMRGDGLASVMPRVMAAGQVGIFAWAAQLGFNFRGASLGSINFGNELRFAASGGVKLFDQRLLVGPELFAVAPVTTTGTSRAFGLEGDLGAHYALTPQWRVGAGVGTGLVNAAGVPDVRVLASLDWSMGYTPPAPPDADGDGVPDASDACPGERGLSARGGCAAPVDDDGDGVANADDLCPAQSAVGAADPKRRGCALAPDADGDGVTDARDLCPGVAPVGAMNPSRPGCPDGDADGDAVMASLDECPAVAAGPRPDPAHPGCPSPDADGDTVSDAADRCPHEPGAPASEPDRDGCPGLVRYEVERLLPNSPVYFRPGTATLLPSSFPVLEAARSALQAMPWAERVAVEGHTDATGKVAANQALSEARAQAVMKWLVEHGIAADRLTAQGYGMTRLLIPGEKTEADRQTNRRVEFRVLQTR